MTYILLSKKIEIRVQKNQKRIQFLNDQIHEMEKHKYIESEKAGKDLGDSALLDWIIKYAASFREEWERIHGKVEEDDGSDNSEN